MHVGIMEYFEVPINVPEDGGKNHTLRINSLQNSHGLLERLLVAKLFEKDVYGKLSTRRIDWQRSIFNLEEFSSYLFIKKARRERDIEASWLQVGWNKEMKEELIWLSI